MRLSARVSLWANVRQLPSYEFRLKTVSGRLLPGVDLTDRDKLFDLMERG